MNKWISVDDAIPPEGDYVLVSLDEWIGISRFIDGEWDTGEHRRIPIFTKSERTRSSANPIYWMPLPKPPEENGSKPSPHS